ncbi:glutamine-tRNA ligase [Mycena vitilis]|nr:glutamine-tRNA ligase [Mycena vitilis]
MSKPAKADPALDPVVPLLKSIGLSQAKAVEAVKSPKIAAELKDIIEAHGLHTRAAPLDDKQAGLIVALAGQLVKTPLAADAGAEEKRAYVVGQIVDARLKTVDQVVAAVKYVEGHPTPIHDADFDKSCGVGFSITAAELYEQIAKYTTSAGIAGWASLGQVISGVKNIPELRWANTLEVKNTVEKVFKDKFGAKEAAKPKAKEPKKAAGPAKTEASADDSASRKSVFEEGFLGQLHKPGENPQIRPEFREQHLAATGGKVFTRFPPEPNGYLHIGHSKAIFVDFGYAAHHGGKCYLRFDDTNPEKEEAQYFESILEMVRWLGFEPWKITYSSDYFQRLYELAVELIKRDKAYVCHCTQEEIKAARGEKSGALPRACVHRTRPISESLAEFQKMKDGFYRPKEANLRMKQDLEDGNPQMWDLTAYRVLETPHQRTHDKWKIYPTYDYTHCLVDSFENISHSLCTTEFVASRQSYEWLCDALEVYKPRQSEFGRLNLEGTIMSKRKILALVQKGYVNGWDDPRLYTLIALRRRGVPPGAIVSFVSTLGVSTATSSIELARFEQTVRHYLEGTAPRLLMVLKPLKVTIENLPEDYLLMVEKPLHPKIAALGTTTIPFTRNIYIDADDFRLEDSKDYFRLAPGKTVGLFQAPHPITCTSYKTDPASGQVTELICRLEDGAEVKKPKAYIQWVADHAPSGSPVHVDETRIFHQLFKSDQPASDFLDDVDPNSLEVVRGALVETGFWSLAKRSLTEARREGKERTEKALKNSAQAESTPGDDTPRATSEQLVGKECIRFQGLRVAYFAVDKDSRLACLDEAEGVPPARKQGDYLVLNRVVSLKEDSGKAA